MMNKTDKSLVIVTGATRGLGLAMTEEFIRRGLTVGGVRKNVERHRTIT